MRGVHALLSACACQRVCYRRGIYEYPVLVTPVSQCDGSHGASIEAQHALVSQAQGLRDQRIWYQLRLGHDGGKAHPRSKLLREDEVVVAELSETSPRGGMGS